MSRQLMIAEVLSQPQAVSWLPWAVQYFFFIGIAACAALLACVGAGAVEITPRIWSAWRCLSG